MFHAIGIQSFRNLLYSLMKKVHMYSDESLAEEIGLQVLMSKTSNLRTLIVKKEEIIRRCYGGMKKGMVVHHPFMSRPFEAYLR